MSSPQETKSVGNSIELIVLLPSAADSRLGSVSDTLFDGVQTEPSSVSGDRVLRIESVETLASVMDPSRALLDGIDAVYVDMESMSTYLSPVLVGLGAICSMWSGGKLIVSVPASQPENTLSPLCDLLRSLEARAKGVRIISCPTCARCHTDLVGLTKDLEGEIKKHGVTMDVALMGCEVNGPGEAKAADVGVAFGKGIGILFRNGEVIKRLPEAEAGQALLAEVAAIASSANESD